MGLLSELSAPAAQFLENKSITVLVLTSLFAFVSIAIVLNVLQQLLLKKPNEPPVVFHWIPIIGSTITYGMEPIAFFKRCHEKVCR
jgi:hypothetical protein